MTDGGHGVMEMEFLAFKMNMDIGGVIIEADRPSRRPRRTRPRHCLSVL